MPAPQTAASPATSYLLPLTFYLSLQLSIAGIPAVRRLWATAQSAALRRNGFPVSGFQHADTELLQI